MTNIERRQNNEAEISPELPRVFFGEDDSPELWSLAGLRLPDANLIAGAKTSGVHLGPILRDGVTVVLQPDSKNALVLRGAVEAEDHMSLGSVAVEAASKHGYIPDPPEIPGTSWNDELNLKVRRDWQRSFNHLAQKSETARKAIQNSGAWLIFDSKEDLKGFDIAQNEWEKEVLEAERLNLDKDFGDEVRGLRKRFTAQWSSVSEVDSRPVKVGNLSRVFSGVALASSLPFNPAIQEKLAPMIQPADQETQAMLSDMLQVQRDQQSNFYTEDSASRYSSMGSMGVALEFYEDYLDKLIPDTPPEQVEKAREALGIGTETEVQGGFSGLAPAAYDAVLARGGTEEEAKFAVKAAGMGYFQTPDGQRWLHVYGKGEAHLEEVTRETVQENTSVRAIAEGLRKAYEQESWGDEESVGGTPVPTVQPTPSEAIAAPEETYSGNIAIASDEVEQDFLRNVTGFDAEGVTPIVVNVGGKDFELVEATQGKYYMNIDGVWKELYRTEQKIGEDNYIVLQYLPRIPAAGETVQLESILWYPALTEDQWKAMSPEQRAQPWIHFAPPTEMEDEISGFDREEDQGIPVFLPPDLGVPSFLISLELKNTNFIVSDSPATQIPPSEGVTGTPEAPPTEVRQFENHPASEFDEYYIAPEDLLDFAEWKREQLLESGISLPEPDPDKVRAFPAELQGVDLAFLYVKVGGIEIEPADRPFLAGDSFGNTTIDYISYGTPGSGNFAVSTVAFAVPGNPEDLVVAPVILMNSTNREDLESRLTGWAERGSLQMSAKGENYTLMVIDDLNQENAPDLEYRLNKFYETLDPTWLKGIIFGAHILD